MQNVIKIVHLFGVISIFDTKCSVARDHLSKIADWNTHTKYSSVWGWYGFSVDYGSENPQVIKKKYYIYYFPLNYFVPSFLKIKNSIKSNFWISFPFCSVNIQIARGKAWWNKKRKSDNYLPAERRIPTESPYMRSSFLGLLPLYLAISFNVHKLRLWFSKRCFFIGSRDWYQI